jgi:hypothetical protein
MMAGHLVTPEGWTPEFPGQRPPFHPGNELAVTHGAYSSKRTDPIARRYIDEIAEDPGLEYLQAPRFHATLWAWASAMAKVELLQQWVDNMPIQAAADSDKGKTSALELLRKWMTTAQGFAGRLGLDPLSAARLGKDIAGTRQADAATLLTRARAEAEQNIGTTH